MTASRPPTSQWGRARGARAELAERRSSPLDSGRPVKCEVTRDLRAKRLRQFGAWLRDEHRLDLERLLDSFKQDESYLSWALYAWGQALWAAEAPY